MGGTTWGFGLRSVTRTRSPLPMIRCESERSNDQIGLAARSRRYCRDGQNKLARHWKPHRHCRQSLAQTAVPLQRCFLNSSLTGDESMKVGRPMEPISKRQLMNKSTGAALSDQSYMLQYYHLQTTRSRRAHATSSNGTNSYMAISQESKASRDPVILHILSNGVMHTTSKMTSRGKDALQTFSP